MECTGVCMDMCMDMFMDMCMNTCLNMCMRMVFNGTCDRPMVGIGHGPLLIPMHMSTHMSARMSAHRRSGSCRQRPGAPPHHGQGWKRLSPTISFSFSFQNPRRDFPGYPEYGRTPAPEFTSAPTFDARVPNGRSMRVCLTDVPCARV